MEKESRLLIVSVAAAIGLTIVFFGGWLLVAAMPHQPHEKQPAPLAALAHQLDPARPTRPVNPEPITSPSTNSARCTDTSLLLTRLQEENRRLRQSNAMLQERLKAVLQWILANFRGRYPVPEQQMHYMKVPVFTEDGTLNPELAELLRLTPDELQKIDDALRFAQTHLAEIESALITVSEPRPGKVVLHIPMFEESGEMLKEDLYAALEATLGHEKFNRFLKVAEKSLREEFYHFGKASRTMIFELNYSSATGAPQLLIKDGYIIEVEPGVREITARESVSTNLPPAYLAYVAWLPEYMVEPARKSH